MEELNRNSRKLITGRVTSSKMDKTIVVSVVSKIKHAKYHKYFKKSKKFYAHDETNTCNANDIVKIMETRPLSSKKRWRLVEVIERAK